MRESWPLEGSEMRGRTTALRGTQSFVRVMQWCWQHPAAVAFEVLWRWVFGLTAIWLVVTRVVPVVMRALGGQDGIRRLGLERMTLLDPTNVATRVAQVSGLLLPDLRSLALRLGPALLALWILLSTGGRLLVLRRVDRGLAPRPGTVAVLQLLRLIAFGTMLALWLGLVRWASSTTVGGPIARGEDPGAGLLLRPGDSGDALSFCAVGAGQLVFFTRAAAGDANGCRCRAEPATILSGWPAADEVDRDQSRDGCG